MQITAKRQREKRRKLEKSGKDREEVLKGGPNKTTRGDLKGRRADLKGSKNGVSDLKKGKAETLKKQTAETSKNSSTKSGGY